MNRNAALYTTSFIASAAVGFAHANNVRAPLYAETVALLAAPITGAVMNFEPALQRSGDSFANALQNIRESEGNSVRAAARTTLACAAGYALGRLAGYVTS